VNFRARLEDAARHHLPPEVKRQLRVARRAVLRRIGSTGYSRLGRARTAFHAGNYETAARLLADTRSRRPDDPEVLRWSSRVEMRRGNVTDAAQSAMSRAALILNPTDWHNARQLAGRVRETAQHWQPLVSAPPPHGPTAGDRIVYLAKESRPFLHNGFCTRTHESLQSLLQAGWEITGATMPGFPAVLGIRNPPTESRVDDVIYQHLLPQGAEFLTSLAFDEYLDLSTQVLAGFVARQRPALLHVGSGHRGFETALVGNAVARWARIPWIYEVRSFFETTWTSDPRYREQGEYYDRRFATETRMMNAADLVITLSGPMRDEIAEQHGIPTHKIRVVPNAVDLQRFAAHDRDQQMRERLGLAGSFTLGYVSNLSHPREGQEVLIRAIQRLRSQGHNVTGLLVGDGSRRAELEQLARKVGLAKHIVFTGNVPFDQVAELYAQIDLFVVPRIDERAARMVSPMKPFEAMAMNIPLLVADLPALVEIAGSGGRAHTFRAGDAESLAQAARALMDAPAERARIADEASRWVKLERSWSTVAKGFGEAYDQLLDQQPSRARREGLTC
jgi:phosphatidyl-myo-inositol dimannoside synthase